MSVFNKSRFTLRRKRKLLPALPPEEMTPEDRANANDKNDTDKELYEEIIPAPVLPDEMPTYFHIGVLAKECLVNGYKIGAWHFDCTTDIGDNLALYSFGTGKPQFKNVFGGVGAREYLGSLSLTQVWMTDGLVGMVGLENELYGGTANTLLRAAYEQNDRSGVKVELHSGYEVTPFKFHMIIPVLREPKLMGYVLLNPFKQYLLAYRAVYDIENKGFDKHAIGLGFYNGSTEWSLKLENFEDLRGSVFQRLGDRFAIAAKVNCYKSEEKQYAIGAQVTLFENVIIKAKYRHDGFFGMVYQQTLNDNIAIMYHFGFAIKDPFKGDHKFGLSWSMRA
ncbi:PREDICTED: voltage-dependent anion-selective channel-like [Drosophila arizonae]|uniref:Voltage-dependent anion-selective channel-like n=1 Tax=Drosophila arizonae TaxID=7263 RepID=A0ABM1NQ77_DROAR|nr:PREDICTED: voltage-dependent anion-selective channel-like [Drosophila arizonae]